jgi:hypothetical protein
VKLNGKKGHFVSAWNETCFPETLFSLNMWPVELDPTR